MDPSLQISFRHMPVSAALEARIRALAAQLARFSAHILSCHVVVEMPHRHHEQGNRFEVRIEIGVPGRLICVHGAQPDNQAQDDPYVALRDAFRAARRQLQDYERGHHHTMHAHDDDKASSARGRISARPTGST